MQYRHFLAMAAIFLAVGSTCRSQANPRPESATVAVLRAFEPHNIVMLGETHGNKQEYEWLRSLVGTPAFADRVDDIVVEFGNSLYQKSVDRYVSGEDVPIEQVQKAWRDLVGAIGPPSPVYASFYQAVREMNLRRKGKHQMRILCGNPYIDWGKVKDRDDIGPYFGNRDRWYTQVVKEEVLAKRHRALLIMGSAHFMRGGPPVEGTASIEQELRSAGAKTYLIVAGTNVRGNYDDIDHRFDSWSAPQIVSLSSGWVGELPMMPVISGGTAPLEATSADSEASAPAPKLKDVADALLYLGPRDSLIQVFMTRAELDDTPYGKEVERRLTIQGFPTNIIATTKAAPQFYRPRPAPRGGGLPQLPPPVRNIDAPLPPRPPSQ